MLMQGKGQYINGIWTKGSGTILESINPAYGSLLWEGTNGTEEDIILAVQAARQALDSWSNKDVQQRMEITRTFAQNVESNREQLAKLICEETGKPLWEARTEVATVVGKIGLSIQAFQERTGQKITQGKEANSVLRYKPQGIVAVLGAFNFPAHLSNGHIVPALLAGNTIVYKPSEQTPAVAELIMQYWHESGLPAGVLNCIQGGIDVGVALLNQDIQGVYFTGSYAAGLAIHQHFSKKPEVILALEMGGNNPLIVDDIRDIKAAVYHTLLSSFITSGQRCTCARRVMIPKTQTGDLFLQQLITACQAIKIGPYDNEVEPFMGPVISHIQALKLLHAQKMLLESGGISLLSMRLLAEYTGLLSPGIIDMTHVAIASDEELFGPLIQIYRYDNFEQAIYLANQTNYGLAASLLSDNEAHYQLFYKKIRAGLVNWNRSTTGASGALPFGGVGFSGNHRPSGYFAADYCAYPVASMETAFLNQPQDLLPGIVL